MAINKDNNRPTFISTTQLAKLMGISRVAILKKIKTGKIHAQKVGRNYIISAEEFAATVGEFVSPAKKAEIERVVKKAVKEYRETLRLLGRE
jgi:excisionase family DNA binding protein